MRSRVVLRGLALMSKASDAGRKAEGVAQAGAGAGVLAGALSANRGVNAAERAARGRVDDWKARKLSVIGDPVTRTVPGASRGAKEQAKAKTRAAQGQVNAVNERANRAKRAIRVASGGKTRGALITAGFAAAAPNVWLGSRKVVEKKADQHDVDAFMGGALGTAGAYHGGLYATKKIDRRIENNIAADPDATKRVRDNKKKYGVPKNASKGDRRWLAHHRNFPKGVPGSKFKRAMSYAHGGKSQVAITGGLAALGGLAAAKVNRKVHPMEERNKVRKSDVRIMVSKQGSLKPLTKPKTAKKPKMPKAPVNAAKPRVAGKPSINRSYVATSRAGKKFSARGSVR